MFKTTVTPKFGDLDGLRHINNNTLGDWFETGRNELFRIFTPVLYVVYEHWKLILVHNDYDYLKQIFLGHDVEIRTHLLKIGNSSFTLGQEAWQDGKLKVKGTCVLVHFDFMEQKSVPIPDDIRLQLEKHLIPVDEFGKE
nr:thioesterase family protein [Methanobrevibacter smithii]